MIDTKTKAKLKTLVMTLCGIDAEIAKAAERRTQLLKRIGELSPWSEDMPEEERASACVVWPGLGTLRRVWAKGRRSINVARLLEHVSKDVIEQCTDTGEETTRVQFFPEREVPVGAKGRA